MYVEHTVFSVLFTFWVSCLFTKHHQLTFNTDITVILYRWWQKKNKNFCVLTRICSFIINFSFLNQRCSSSTDAFTNILEMQFIASKKKFFLEKIVELYKWWGRWPIFKKWPFFNFFLFFVKKMRRERGKKVSITLTYPFSTNTDKFL